jgi:hypothetical protein
MWIWYRRIGFGYRLHHSSDGKEMLDKEMLD